MKTWLAGWLAGWPAGWLSHQAHCQRFLSPASKSFYFNVAFINGQVKANNFTENLKETIKEIQSRDEGRRLVNLWGHSGSLIVVTINSQGKDVL